MTNAVVAVGKVNEKDFEDHKDDGRLFIKYTNDQGHDSDVFEFSYTPAQVLGLKKQLADVNTKYQEGKDKDREARDVASKVATITDTRSLDLSGKELTDDNFQTLGHLLLLRKLVMAEATFDEKNLRHLPEIPSLMELSLAKTKITDAGLNDVGRIDNLQTLDLS